MATIPSDTAPQQYALQNKLVKTAKKRRNSTTEAVSQLAKLLPLPSGTNKEKLKTNHILRLAVSYIRMKQLIQGSIMPLYGKERGKKSCNMRRTTAPLQGVSLAKKRRLHMSQSLQLPSGDVLNVLKSKNNSILLSTFCALDGFLLVIQLQSSAVDILYVSESVFDHLGLYMVDLMGQPLFSLVVGQDHGFVKEALALHVGSTLQHRSFFCQMRSAQGRRPNGRTKCPGQKLVHVSGQMHCYWNQLPFATEIPRGSIVFIGVVRVVRQTAVEEPRFPSWFLKSRATLDLIVIELNTRPIHRSFNCKDYWHPEDIPWILESFDKLLKFGHVIWMCHRILHDGKWKWIQAQSRVVANQYLDTTVSFVSEEVGKRALMLRGSHERENSSSGVEAYLSQQTVASLSLQIDGFSDCYLEKPVPSMSPAYLSDNYSMSEETARFHNSKDAQPLQPNLSDNAQSRNSLFSRSSLRHSLTSQCAPLQQLHKTHCSPAENCFTDTSCRWSCSDCSSTSTMSHGEVDSLFGGFDCLDDDPNLGIESVIVNSNVVKIEFPSWNLHCPTYAMSSGSSVNDSLVTSNQETISDSVSKRHLVDTACISVPPKFTWCPAPTRNLFMDTSHQHFGYFNERQPAPMFSEAVFAEKWNERSHTHSGSVLTDDLRSTDVTTFCSISTCAHHPVYAIQMPNSTPETETDRAIEDVCNEDFGDLQPLTWDWTVGIDVNTALHQ